jgi:hypothetical protein
MPSPSRTPRPLLVGLLLITLPALARAHAAPAVPAPLGERQTTSTVFMVSPDDFAFNAETAGSNRFQDRSAEGADARAKAMLEFDAAVEALRKAGIRVIRMASRADVKTPDAVFPNNWFSLHSLEGGPRVLVGYPMLAPNRRLERRLAELQARLSADGLPVDEVIDLSPFEEKGLFLEGTGSMVLDRANRIAYAALSPRTDPAVLQELARRMQYRPVRFRSYDAGGALVYHTNVMMSVGSRFAVVCADSIRDPQERRAVVDQLKRSGKEVIPITQAQMGKMAGNILELQSGRGPVIVMSRTAYDHFTPEQRASLEHHGRLLPLAIPTIEAIGGGSARCMLGELF